MKKTMKKILCTVLVVVMCLTVAPLKGFIGIEWPEINFDEWFSSEASAAGTCGGNATWSYNKENKELIISGKGRTRDIGDIHYSGVIFDGYNWVNGQHSGTPPWNNLQNDIQKITVLEGITHLGTAFFERCFKATEISLPSTLVEIGDMSLQNLDAKEIVIPENVKNIGVGAFSRSLIEYVIIPDSVTTIEQGAFEYCKRLVFVKIGAGVNTIPIYAFYDCVNLERIIIPKEVTSITYCAFLNCDKLTDIYYAGSEDDWKKIYIGACNSQLENATIHYNSTGPDDIDDSNFNPNNPDDPDNPVDPDNPNDDNSNDENTDISIKFKPDAYEVEVDYTVTLSATVTCPAGVENSNLDMVWEIIEPDGTELLYDGEYSRSETEWACYAEIRGLKAGTYFVNLCDKNSGVFDTAEIHVYEYYHPETPPEPYIQCDDTSVEYKQNVDIDNRKKFTINGHITNDDEEHTLTDISITIKSPDANKAVFKTENGYKESVTFPLGKTIETGKSRDFKCTAYIKRGYNPPNGAEDLTFTCILHGKLDGKEVNGIYSDFKVKIINLSYDVPEDPKGGWRSITMIELLDFLFTSRDPKGVLYIDRYPGRGSYNMDDLELKSRYTAIKAIGAVQSTIELSEALNEQLEAAINVTELGNISAIKMHKAIIGIGQEALNVLFDAYKDKAKKKLSAYYNKEIQDLLESEIFDHYLKWYSDEVNYINGNTTKITKRCPIDIYVTDEEGYNVLQITDSNIKIFDEYADAYLSGDEKILYLPNDIGHNIKTLATDNGEMDYVIESYSKQGEYRIVEYKNIPLTKGKSYTSIVPSDISSKTDVYNPVSEDGKTIKADKDETEHKYGDKDKNCQLCGFDRTQGCSCKCHKNGIAKFFFKIILFFQKIFRTNKTCSCGVAHY